jgi:hypothetical protein
LSKSITGSFVLSNGSPVSNGTLYLQLSQNAVTTATPAVQVGSHIFAVPLDINGSITAGTVVWANDELAPAGTYYKATVNLNGGGKVWGPQYVTLTGAAPILLTNFTPSNPVV